MGARHTNDSWQMSMMSYFSQTDNPTADAFEGFLPTEMMADIVAIQTIYTTTGGSGITSTGYSIRDVALTIYDQEGRDTLDLSTSTTDDPINLWHSTSSDVQGGGDGRP